MPTINEMIDFCEDMAAYDCFSNEQFARREMFYAIADELKKKKRPRGEWHTTPNPNHSPFDSTSEVIYMCSKCDYSNGDRIAAAWNFCPNCGADMREGKADE